MHFINLERKILSSKQQFVSSYYEPQTSRLFCFFTEEMLPAAIRAAFAKFPVSMQAMSSLLSSTVCLRTRAGLPFPHFGRLGRVLEAKKGMNKSEHLLPSCGAEGVGWTHHLPSRLLHEDIEDSEAQRLRGSTARLFCSSLFSFSTSGLDRPGTEQERSIFNTLV